MGNKRITEKDFWICTEGNIPTQFQGTRNLQKKISGEKYIVEADKVTVGCREQYYKQMDYVVHSNS